ncbi:MAG: acetyl-CoA carboxylase biotin carboxyl carrier protein subunit [Thiolinea sp.]
MPGQVKLIHTEVGAQVSKGDVLLVMEAMKMELSLNAPRDGVVAELSVAAGDQVTEGRICWSWRIRRNIHEHSYRSSNERQRPACHPVRGGATGRTAE